MPDLQQYYSGRIDFFSVEIVKKKKELLIINSGRFFSFALMLTFPFWIYPTNHLLGVLLTFISLVLFLLLVKRNGKVSAEKKYLENRVTICSNELSGLSHNFSCFDPGNEFIDPYHINSYDLDLFGKGSIFQFINRTVTFRGKSMLAGMIGNPILDPVRLKKRQGLVAELISDCEWRQDFAASGMMYTEEKDESELFNQWGKEKFKLLMGNSIPVLLVILPLISLSSIVYWIITGSSGFFILAGLFQLILWLHEKKNISLIYRKFGKRVEILTKYSSLLAKIEKREWKSVEAKEMLAEIEMKGFPSKEISLLRRIVSAFDNRNNFIVGFLLNIVFAWDVLCSYRLIKWHERNIQNYEVWDSTIAFFDAICTLSNMAYNHPQFVFPTFTSGKFHFEAEKLGHPLIKPGKMVTNHFNLGLEKQVVIVTGANMAGKSTFLRTVGVNMILGMAGGVVCASKMSFVPVEVFSNMRTTDSLFDEESYFFAELKRIKSILDAVESGRHVLIILDEILKGTNSVDKLSGSQRLVKKLIALKVPAVIATHDLKLTEMKAEYPDSIQNNCFEITIQDNEMSFDYKLRDGVTQTMNATFLMKKMGII